MEIDYRWIRDDGTKYTWLETLQAMCDYYGTFQGRWHSNEFWTATKKQILSMSEKEAEKKIRKIEVEAEAELWYWRQTQ